MLDADDAVRRLTLAPHPGFTLSLREPGPVNEKISNAFLKQVTLNHLSSRISISSCVVQVLIGSTVQVHFRVRA